MQQLLSETTIVEDFMEAVSQFHFSDSQSNSTQMAEFGDQTIQYLFLYASIDLEMSSVIESKYLSAVKNNADIARLLTYFSGRFEQLGQQHESEFSDKGVFMLPLHRNFTYLMSR